MIAADPIVAGPDAVGDVKTYLRVTAGGEDALIARLIATAIVHGEMVTRRMLIARSLRETLTVSAAWTRMTAAPVTAIAGVTDGVAALPVEAYAIDIDADGDGWIRLTAAGPSRRVTVQASAGIAADWAGLPDPLRQGAVRLAAHLYAHRDAGDEAAPPAAVAALWRPWRRMVLA